jgi:hypothetical protein
VNTGQKRRRSSRSTPSARRHGALVSTGLGLLALAQASPASSAERPPGLHWTPDRTGAGAADDGHLSGTVRLLADVSSAEPVDGWSLEVLTDGLRPAFGAVCRQAFPRPRDTFRINCPWDTTRFDDQRPSPNRHYVIRVSTHRGDTVEAIGDGRPVALLNPAAAPDDVAVAFDNTTGVVRLTWAANTEPDLTHYDVEENFDDRGWVRIGEPTGPSFQQRVTEPGEYRYRVGAERNTPDGSRSGPGPWGSPNRSSDEVRVAPAKPATASGSEADDREDDTERRRRTRTRRRADEGRSAPPARDRSGQRDDDGPPDRPGGATEEKGRADPGRRPPPTTTSGAAPPEPVTAPPAGPSGTASPAGPATAPPARSELAAPAADAPAVAPAAALDPAPADHAALSFSAASGRALASLHDHPPFAPALPPAPARFGGGDAAVEHEPDTGFRPTLPYADTDHEDAAPASSPSDGAAASAAPEAAATRRHRHHHRPEGVGVLVVAAGLLATAVRPTPRKRAPRRRSRPMGEAARIAALEERLAQLESRLLSSRSEIN